MNGLTRSGISLIAIAGTQWALLPGDGSPARHALIGLTYGLAISLILGGWWKARQRDGA